MKKLIAILLLAVFTVACTKPNAENPDYEVQIIDKDKVVPPGERDKNGG